MKRFLKIALAAMAAAFLSCSKDEAVEQAGLNVIPSNLEGCWQLSEWMGEALPEGNFVYMELTRQDKKFTIYENMRGTSTVTCRYSGTYGISDGNVIKGIYDNSIYTYWAHDYEVSGLTGDRMVWTATDNPEDVSVYVRVDSIPGNISGEALPGNDEKTENR